jgi:hypothetical protein
MTDDITALRNAINNEARRIYNEGGKKEVLKKSIRDIAIELTLSGWRPVDPALEYARCRFSRLAVRNKETGEFIDNSLERCIDGEFDQEHPLVILAEAFRAGVAHAEGRL